FQHLSYCWSFADQRVRVLKRYARIGQQACGHAGYVFRTNERNDGFFPAKENGVLLGNASANESAHVFIVGWCLEMNCSDPRPIEDAIGQSMLQIAETGSVLQIAKAGSSSLP